MSCPHCDPKHFLLAESGDKKAVAELQAEIKITKSPARRAILRAQLKALKGEVATTKATIDSLAKAKSRIMAGLPDLLNQSKAGVATPEMIRRWIRMSGVDDSILASIDAAVDKLIPPVWESMEAGDPNLSSLPIGYQETQAVVANTIGSYYENSVIPEIEKVVRSEFAVADITDDSDRTISDIGERLDSSWHNIETEARTQTSAMSRMATQVSAKLAGLDYQIYSGVVDGLTRPFCRELVGLALSIEQIKELDNAQGLSVAVYCGGYNCRHGLAPISEAMIRELDIPMATTAEIKAANRAAKKAA